VRAACGQIRQIEDEEMANTNMATKSRGPVAGGSGPEDSGSSSSRLSAAPTAPAGSRCMCVCVCARGRVCWYVCVLLLTRTCVPSVCACTCACVCIDSDLRTIGGRRMAAREERKPPFKMTMGRTQTATRTTYPPDRSMTPVRQIREATVLTVVRRARPWEGVKLTSF